MTYRSNKGSPDRRYEESCLLERHNDQMLDDLRNKIGSLKRVTIDIRDEARIQNKLLSDMNVDMDSSRGLLVSTMKKLGIVAGARSNKVIFYLVLFSFFIFMCIYYIIK